MFGLRLIVTLLCFTVYMPVLVADHIALITSSVKLRIDAGNSHSWGTGTIIDTRLNPHSGRQEALILTCGHIFRDSQGQGRNVIHLFGDDSDVLVLGKCLFYCLETDLALVAIETPFPVRAIPIAPPSYQILPNQQVWSVGCDHGGDPTVRQHTIMSTDRVFAPRFHYVQVSDAPVSGRSGGGLFSANGYLLGVCSTACPQMDDGHFIPSHVIRSVLDSVNLAHIHQHPSLGEPLPQIAQAAPPTLAPLAPLQPIASTLSIPNTLPPPVPATPSRMFAEHRGAAMLQMCPVERATLEEIQRRRQSGDEVIVIINSPERPSDVIMLNGASEQFLGALTGTPPVAAPTNSVIFSSH